ncbi:Pkinase-domain-containing protein [Obba rivulosa]|uniref:mitogen-activated protein kinase kinase kinase n=1 Tax=Obba rivulosa TaxID=1052685 RepID=A0A8E2DSF0_9APHY|nr:Pkinase-domain-containing protein [Obba rivulosa]
MAAVVASGSGLQALEDVGQPSQASTPTSPTSSVHSVPSLPRPSISFNSSVATNGSSVAHSSVSLDPPPGLPYSEFLRTWSDAHVARWLADIKCGHHAATFRTHDIRGDVLLELDQVTLREMGMHSVGDRLRIVNAVKGLRQKCSSNSSALASMINRPRVTEHGRHSSVNGDTGGYASRSQPRRLESGRPAPLHLTPAGGSPELPRLARDGQDSARPNGIRPLPQQPGSGSSHSTPTTAHSIRANLPPLPPPPRGHPPPPPVRTPRSLHPPQVAISGRRTPTLPDPPVYTAQSSQQASSLLTPTQVQGTWTGQGLAPDSRQGPSGRTPIRSQSPLPFPTSQPQSRNGNRPALDGTHSRNGSLSNPTPPPNPPPNKPPPRPPTNNPHPYASAPQHSLSPIHESFTSQQRTHVPGTASPPIGPSYRVGSGPFARPNTPQHNTPSLDDLRRKLVKFSLPDEAKSATLNVADCVGGVEVLVKALKKFNKLSSRGEHEGAERIETEDGGLSVDGWGAYLDWGHEDVNTTPLSEAQLLSICQASPDDPVRENGLTLRMIGKTRRSMAASPTNSVFSVSHGQRDDLLTPEPQTAQPTSRAMKRASSVSILSGLGVPIPDKELEGAAVTALDASPTKSLNSSRRGPSKLRNFFGQRPPSELITNHLAEYFPNTEKKVLERTRRQSMMRTSGTTGLGRRDSIISWNPPSQSRFSVSTLGSQQLVSPRASMSSPSIPFLEKPASPSPSTTQSLAPSLETAPSITEDPPRLSLSTSDGKSVEISSGDADQVPNHLYSHLLPPVAFPSLSLAESMNLEDDISITRSSSAASKRMSYITELRSKRDRSDTTSLMTVDEITAEVDRRRESRIQQRDSDGSDEWTKVDVEEEADTQSVHDVEIASEVDEAEELSDEETPIDEDEPGKPIMSRGTERTIKWIKGALIGAGSFGKVYLGMDAATGLLLAVKQVDLPTGSAPNEERKKAMLSALEREIELLKDLHHENIVQYHSSCIDEDHLNIFLEYVPGGSVSTVLRNYGAFEEPLVRNWVRQILQGLNYLHERDIIHRDIKGANILVDNKGGIKISDFGISKKVEDNLLPGHRAHRPSLQGSVFWMAPEVVKQTAYTRKADIWSVGCLVVEMLTGEHPWAQLTQMQAIFKIGSSAKPTIPPDISPEADDFLQRTFELDHEARPSAAELLKHPWIVNAPLPLGQ